MDTFSQNTNLIIQLFLALWLIGLVFFVWALGFTEFSYFGSKGIQTLYNLFSFIYELKWSAKEYHSKDFIQKLFLNPLQKALSKGYEAKFLDLACGTGRMSLLTLEQDWFEGSVESVDFSEGMLSKLKDKLSKLSKEKQERIKILFKNLKEWKTNHAEYDAISLMEVGEFLPFFVELVYEVGKAVKPGGLFLLSKPPDWMAWTYFGRCQTSKQLTNLLRKAGFTQVYIYKWTSRYDVVHAWKED